MRPSGDTCGSETRGTLRRSLIANDCVPCCACATAASTTQTATTVARRFIKKPLSDIDIAESSLLSHQTRRRAPSELSGLFIVKKSTGTTQQADQALNDSAAGGNRARARSLFRSLAGNPARRKARELA